MSTDPVTDAIEKASRQLIVLVVSWIGGAKATELVSQVAEEQAEAQRRAKEGTL